MQDLDSFISPVPGFEGDFPIPAILISARDPGAESSEDPSARSSASTSRSRTYKKKAPIDPSPLPQKANKAIRKPLGGIKISGPKQKAPASTHPSRIRKGIPILRSKGILILNTFFYHLSVNPQTSLQSASRYPFSLTCKEPSTRE
jgi:hypothetical protein